MGIDTPIHHPNATRYTPRRALGKPSSRRRRGDPPKLTGHSTETPAGTAKAVASRLEWPYTVICDPVTREILELGPLNYTAMSLRGTHAGTKRKIETNHSGSMHPQVAIVGYAARMHELGDDQLNWLADAVFAPILTACDIPNTWLRAYGSHEKAWLASVNSSIRLSQAACHAFSGVLFHQTWYGQDHWDTGGLNTTHIQARIAGHPSTPTSEAPTMPTTVDILGRGDKGVPVKQLQKLLNDWFQAGLTVDGDFGPATETAVKAAQAKMGVDPDGFWGDKSRGAFDTHQRKIGEAVAEGLQASLGTPANDVDLEAELTAVEAKLEQAEARVTRLEAVIAAIGELVA